MFNVQCNIYKRLHYNKGLKLTINISEWNGQYTVLDESNHLFYFSASYLCFPSAMQMSPFISLVVRFIAETIKHSTPIKITEFLFSGTTFAYRCSNRGIGQLENNTTPWSFNTACHYFCAILCWPVPKSNEASYSYWHCAVYILHL